MQVLDFELRYVYLNKAAASHGRISRAALMDRKIDDVYPGVENTEMFRALQECLRGRVPRQMVNEFTYPDGTSAWFDLRMNPIASGILVLSIDISQRKAAEEHIRESREELATTLDCLSDAVLTADRPIPGGQVLDLST